MRCKEFILERKSKGKKKKSKVKLGKYFYPGFAYYGTGSGDSAEGGGDGGGESIHENVDTADEVEKFKNWACNKLKISNPPKIELSYDTEEAQQGHHTGRHIEGSGNIWYMPLIEI